MASACVNIGVTHDNFHNNLNLPWSSPTISTILPDLHSPLTKDVNGDFEFEFCLQNNNNNNNNNNPVSMLPADELFFDGKLLPLHSTNKSLKHDPKTQQKDEFSPKAPKCYSRWRDFLGFKNKQQIPKSIKLKTVDKNDTSLTSPLLEPSISSSRHSISSSSCSSHEHDDLPRFSLDDKPKRVRLVRQTLQEPKPLIDHRTRRVLLDPSCSIDSPRMNPAGKIVFQSLGRSSSSPSSLNGGPRYKYRGMERSYSANVRVTPVLNVPVCSLRGSSKSGSFGFRQLFSSSSSSSLSSSQRKDKESIRTCVHRKKESTSS